MPGKSIERRLASLVEAQHGVFSGAQALRLGASKSLMQRRVATGRWVRLYPGVFRIAGAPKSWRQALMAACLGWGDDGVFASHLSAAALRGLPGFKPGALEIIVPEDRRRSKIDGIVVHRLPPLPQVDVIRVGAIPVTSVARTLIDIASIASRDVVEEALDDALRRGLVSLPRLRWRLNELGRSGRPGIGMMRSLVAERDGSLAIPQSVFERRVLRVLREAGLPPPIRQHQIRDGGRLIAVVDFAYPDARVVIEADGFVWHSGKARWTRDLGRRNAVTSRGWKIIHLTWEDLTTNRETAMRRVRRALGGGFAG